MTVIAVLVKVTLMLGAAAAIQIPAYEGYSPALAAAFPAVTLIICKLIRPYSRAVGAKLKPYECGVPAESDARGRYSVRFYIIAVLFILFDIEVVFLYPWAVIYRDMLKENAGLIFGSMISFLLILFVGYVYALKKKAFDWKS